MFQHNFFIAFWFCVVFHHVRRGWSVDCFSRSVDWRPFNHVLWHFTPGISLLYIYFFSTLHNTFSVYTSGSQSGR